MKTAIDTLNTSRVLRTIWLNRQISRVEIAKRLELDKSTVTKIVAGLSDKGILEPVGEGQAGPRGGRRPVFLTIRKDFGCILGLEIRSDSYFSTLINLHGEVLASHTEPTQFREDGFVGLFFEILEKEQARITATGLPLIGVGLGVSSLVDHSRGIIRPNALLRLREPVFFKRDIVERVSVPVKIENDANCCCWGELAARTTNRPQDFLFVLGELREEYRAAVASRPSFHTLAVGLGIVIGGRLRYGPDHSAGEFRSILWTSTDTNQFSVRDEEIKRIEEDTEIRKRVLHELVCHVAFLANSLDLRDVIIGGAIEKYWEELAPMLREEIERNWLYERQNQCTVRGSSLGPFAVSYGAAGMFLEHLFSLPDVSHGIGLKATEGVGLLQELQATQSRDELAATSLDRDGTTPDGETPR